MAGTVGKLVFGGGAVLIGYKIGNVSIDSLSQTSRFSERRINERLRLKPGGQVLPRAETAACLSSDVLDVLVVGGNVRASLAALDAASRGLKTGLVDCEDFNSSLESSLLLPCEVGSLAKVIRRLHNEELDLVDRVKLYKADPRWEQTQMAPHLIRPYSLLVLVSKWLELPLLHLGNKLADLLVGKPPKHSSRLVTQTKAFNMVPWANPTTTAGGVEVVEMGADNMRLNLSAVITAARWGALPLNHCQVVHVAQEEGKEHITVGLEDKLNNVCYEVKTKALLTIQEEEQEAHTILSAPPCLLESKSTGVHLLAAGLVLQRHPGLAGAAVCVRQGEGVGSAFQALKDNVAKHYIVRRGDVSVFKESAGKLLGNWDLRTNGKEIQFGSEQDIVEELCKTASLDQLRPSQMASVLLEGGHGWHPSLHLSLVSEFGLREEEARYLVSRYGDQATSLARRMDQATNTLAAEVGHAVEHELAQTLEAVVRRLGVEEGRVGEVLDIMGPLLGWSTEVRDRQVEEVARYFSVLKEREEWKKNESFISELTDDENKNFVETQKEVFLSHVGNDGLMRHAQLEQIVSGLDPFVSEDKLRKVLRQMDLERGGVYSEQEFLSLMLSLRVRRPEEVVGEHVQSLMDE